MFQAFKYLSAFCLVIGLFSGAAHAEENPNKPGSETQNYCSTTNAEICAHIYFPKELVSTEEGIFVVHVVAPNDQQVENFKSELFMDMDMLMGMGHGSTPLVISPLKNNHFRISNAWFVMTGPWLVKTHFEVGGIHYDINLPVMIEK